MINIMVLTLQNVYVMLSAIDFVSSGECAPPDIIEFGVHGLNT